MNAAQPLFWSRLWAHSRLHVMMLALTAVLVGAMLLVLQGWANPFWLDCAVSLVSAFLCWRAGKSRRLAFWTAAVLSVALMVESVPALRARHLEFYPLLLFYGLLIASLWRLPLRQGLRITAAFCGLLTLLTGTLFFFAWQEGQANLQAMVYGVLRIVALWALAPAMETALAGRAPMARFFVILAVVINWLGATLHGVTVLGLDMQDPRPIQAMWLVGDLLFGVGIYFEARNIDVRLWPFMAVGALGMAWMAGLMALRHAPVQVFQVWLLLGGMVFFICALGVARGYEGGLRLARSRFEGWIAVIDDLSRAADESADTRQGLEQVFAHLLEFAPGLLGLEIVFHGGSLVLGEAAGHREVLCAEDGRQVALYAMEDNLMNNEEMRAARPWLTNRLWDLAVKMELRSQAHLDPLSGLMNRRAHEARLPEVLHLAQAQQRPMAVLMVDLDHFKRINDTCGHAVGDQVIQAAAQTMRSFFRPGDLVVRWGGEEFLVVMVGVNRAQAMERAELLRKAINALAIPAVSWPLGVSIGVAGGAIPQSQIEFERWVEAADQAVYVAKRAGRNRVVQAAA